MKNKKGKGKSGSQKLDEDKECKKLDQSDKGGLEDDVNTIPRAESG